MLHLQGVENVWNHRFIFWVVRGKKLRFVIRVYNGLNLSLVADVSFYH